MRSIFVTMPTTWPRVLDDGDLGVGEHALEQLDLGVRRDRRVVVLDELGDRRCRASCRPRPARAGGRPRPRCRASCPCRPPGSWLMLRVFIWSMTSRRRASGLARDDGALAWPMMSRTVPMPGASSRKPFSRIHSSLKIFDRYLWPPSARNTRMRAGRAADAVSAALDHRARVLHRARHRRAARAADEEALEAREVARHEEALLVVDAHESSRILRFMVVGKKSSPMPSTLYEKGLVTRPVLTKS